MLAAHFLCHPERSRGTPDLSRRRRTQITDQPRCVRLELHSVFVSFRAKRRIPLPPLSAKLLHIVVRAIHFDEAARRIQHARSLINALGTDQSGVEAARLHPAQSLDSHGAGVSSSGEIGTTTDRLEMSDAVCSVAPSDAVAEKFAGGIFQHNIEFWIVDRRGSESAVSLDGHLRLSPHRPCVSMYIDARVEVRVRRMSQAQAGIQVRLSDRSLDKASGIKNMESVGLRIAVAVEK